MDEHVFELPILKLCGALETIKEVCENELSCYSCPFNGDTGCKFAHVDTLPCNWEIKYSGDSKC